MATRRRPRERARMISIRQFLRFIVLAVPWLTLSNVAGADVRADFLKLIDRPQAPLNVEVTVLPSTGTLEAFHFIYSTDMTQRVPGILLRSPAARSGRHAVVIALHGTGGSKSSELPLLRLLAARGFLAVAIDGPYHGERTKAGTGTMEYDDAIFRAWQQRTGHPFYYETVWDVMRLIDYLDTRDDVDKTRIGLIGISKGGIETYLSAAVDPRIAVAIPCIGLESFKWALDNNDWQTRIGTIQPAFDAAARTAGVTSASSNFVREFYDRVSPGIDGEFDGPSMVQLIAPRPLMAINGDSDDHTPLPGLRLCIDAAQSAYRAQGVGDRFVVRIEPRAGHTVTADSQAAAIDWFAKWLKPELPLTQQ